MYNERVMGPAHAVNVLDEAIKTALAYRGVAHVNIPKDIQEWKPGDDKRSGINVKRTAPTFRRAALPRPAAERF